MTDWAIRTSNLGKKYDLYARPIDRVRELLSPTRATYHKEVWALREASIEIERGTVTGLIGVNGAGKSTFLKLMSGKLSPTEGSLEAKGRISSILELGTGFQPHLTGRQNALVNALFLGQRPWEAESRIEQILAFAELGEYGDQPLSTYSSGMQARLAFAVLTTLDPEILVLDEALATGDLGFADKCKAFLRGLCRSGCTTLVASHDCGFMADACDRVAWLDHGRVREYGAPQAVIQAYVAQLGRHAVVAPRPRNALVKIEARDPSLGHAFVVHSFEWLTEEGRVLAEHYVGEGRGFGDTVTAAVQLGLTPGSAAAGWGETQSLGSQGGLCRACRPDLGPGGAAFVGLPVPALPEPTPARLRIALHRTNPTPAVISILANGRFVELGRIEPNDQDPWQRAVFDVTSVFRDEGQSAPRFDEGRVRKPAGTAA
jgi:ABC-type polysaccharide/polyol phosphate transport system ATPase subunit